jgi:hypothetical protein
VIIVRIFTIQYDTIQLQIQDGSNMTGTDFFKNIIAKHLLVLTVYRLQVLTRAGGRVEVVASLSQGRTAAAQCGLFTRKSVPVIFEPPCNYLLKL